MSNQAGMLILKRLSDEELPILYRIVLERAVLYPASSRIAFNISTVELLPFVPVTPIILIFLEGNLNTRAAKKANTQW